jgi:hypothetical protein
MVFPGLVCQWTLEHALMHLMSSTIWDSEILPWSMNVCAFVLGEKVLVLPIHFFFIPADQVNGSIFTLKSFMFGRMEVSSCHSLG